MKLKLRSIKDDALEISKILKRYSIFSNIKTIPIRNTKKGMYVIAHYNLKDVLEVKTLKNELSTRFIIRAY
jgi:hypothetical protein